MRWIAPALLLLTASVQPSPNPQVDWRWDRDTPSCALRQTVSEGVVVSISRTPGSDQTSIGLGGDQPNYEPPETFREAEVHFAPGEQISHAVAFVSKGSRGREVYANSYDTTFLRKFGESNSLEFTHEKLSPIRVPLRSASAAASAIRACEDANMREWGIDPVAWHALKARPIPIKEWTSWLSPDDYPATAVMNGIQGVVISKMEVGADGSVVSCESIRRNRSPTYRDRICEKLKHRAHFEPALDSSGKPVAAPYVIVIKFRLE